MNPLLTTIPLPEDVKDRSTSCRTREPFGASQGSPFRTGIRHRTDRKSGHIGPAATSAWEPFTKLSDLSGDFRDQAVVRGQAMAGDRLTGIPLGMGGP